MRKKLITTCMAVVMIFSLAISASANAFTPSAENKPAPSVGESTIEGIIIEGTDSVEGDFPAAYDTVKAISSTENVEVLVGDTEMENPKVSVVANIIFPEGSNTEDTKVTLTNTGIASNQSVKAYSYKNSKWVELSATNNGDGSITLEGDFCPIMLVVDAEEDADVTSPQTNDIANNSFLVIAGLSTLFAVVFAISAKRKEN